MHLDKQKIKDIIKQTTVCSFQSLARKLYLKREDNTKLTKILKEMINDHEIFTTPEYDYYVPKMIGKTINLLSLNSKGFGFVELDDKNSIFILSKNLNGALNGDEVEVQYFEDIKYPEKLQGIITRVVKRNKIFFVGTIFENNHRFSIRPLDNRIRGLFKLTSKIPLQIDDQVKAKITHVIGPFIYCQVVKVLGKSDDVAMDILSAIEDANVPYEFSHEALLEAKKIPQSVDLKTLFEQRHDLRSQLIVTIDGDDTKDFDDAISITKMENGNFILSVHIADVTYYVKEDSYLDHDAKSRGTSVYLVDRVIPMLPTELSNGICSLNPHVDRLTITAQMEINNRGETVKYEIYPSIINSKYRLTYQDVNKYYHDQHSFHDEKLHKMLDDSLELSRIIRKFKQREGYIDFEIVESKIIVDEFNRPIKIIARERGESEMMIEDFMVRANETVAHHVANKKFPFIYRVHDKPDLERLTTLESVVKVLGLEIKMPRHAIPREFANAINQIKQFRFDDFMKVMMLRTMAKAVYSPQNIGHFGLASDFYTHFTSPIRRYPDLMVHRMLRAYFFTKSQQDIKKHFNEILPLISDSASLAEQRAMELERKVDDIKKAQFYEQFLGQSFNGQITTINKYGFFVEFPNKVGGLVHASTMLDNKYEVTSNGLVFASKNRKLTIGDEVNVTVVNIHKNEGKIDLILTEFYDRWKQNNFIEKLSN